MRMIAIVLLAGMLLGCQNGMTQQQARLLETNTDTADGLLATIQVPGRQMQVGQEFRAAISVLNSGQQTQTIESTSGALVYVKVMRYTPVGWVEVKRYPQVATAALKPWTLVPGTGRSFSVPVQVERDWPTNEPLRLTAEINGRPELDPGIVVEVRR